MRIFGIFFILSFSAFIQIFLNSHAVLWNVSFPFLLFAFLYTATRMSGAARLWTAILCGVFFENISPYPFGAYILSFIFVAFLVTFLEYFFSRSEPHFTEAIVLGSAIVLFHLSLGIFANLISVVRVGTSAIPLMFLLPLVLAGILWGAAASLFFLGAHMGIQFFRK